MSLVVDFDDFGCNHVISDQCQSHDCRDKLLELKEINPNFKVTLFAIPGEMTPELLMWGIANKSWIELAVHGFWHLSNYECEKLTYEQFDSEMNGFIADSGFFRFFVKGFKAPGWQISDDIYGWLKDHGWWVADQGYNDSRRPLELKSYINNNGRFTVNYNGTISEDIPASHHHTWDTVGNGIYEQFDYLLDLVKNTETFKFVSEIIDEKTKVITGEIRSGG